MTGLQAHRWRLMTEADLPAVSHVAATVHPEFPERGVVFAERLQLYPQGCRALTGHDSLSGYVLSHPWRGAPPKLDSLLGALPVPDVYYLHDLAVLPAQRGTGVSSSVVRDLLAHARQAGFGRAALVAVNNSLPFWSRLGFQAAGDPAMQRALASYGDDARYMICDLSPV